MNTAIIITIVICITLLAMDIAHKIAQVCDRKNYYDMVAKYPEALQMTEEDFKKWQSKL